MNNAYIFLLIAAAIVFTIFGKLGGTKGKSKRQEFKYKKVDRLVSPAERSFLGVLKSILDDDTMLLTKVRVADVLTPAISSPNDRSLWQKSFNRIAAKHFDFVLCRTSDLKILCAIELNDRSHNKEERRSRDEFLRAACLSADLPFIEVPAKNGYILQEVFDLIRPYVKPSLTTQCEPETIQSTETTSSTLDHQHHSNKELGIVCDKCGSQMVLRKKNRGEQAGQMFYGCSGFPKCRNIRNIEPNI